MLEKLKKPGVREWLGVGIYVMVIFLTCPFLPAIIRFSARISKIELEVFLLYVKRSSLCLLALSIVLALFLTGCYKNIVSWLTTVFVGIMFAYLTSRTAAAAEAAHFLEYGFLSVYIFYTLAKIKNNSYAFDNYYKAFLIASLLGIMDELYQGLLPTRYYDINDIILNVASALLGLIFIWGTFAHKTTEAAKCPV